MGAGNLHPFRPSGKLALRRLRRHLWPVPKMIRKGDLPTKLCATCRLPFTWRKKWARDWDQVLYCSERCRRAPPSGTA
jgi:hypothetical protein